MKLYLKLNRRSSFVLVINNESGSIPWLYPVESSGDLTGCR